MDIGCSAMSKKSFWSSTISVRMPPRVSHHRSQALTEHGFEIAGSDH
jgi:hypothetical protein